MYIYVLYIGSPPLIMGKYDMRLQYQKKCEIGPFLTSVVRFWYCFYVFFMKILPWQKWDLGHQFDFEYFEAVDWTNGDTHWYWKNNVHGFHQHGQAKRRPMETQTSAHDFSSFHLKKITQRFEISIAISDAIHGFAQSELARCPIACHCHFHRGIKTTIPKIR